MNEYWVFEGNFCKFKKYSTYHRMYEADEIDTRIQELEEEVKKSNKAYMVLDDDCMFKQGQQRETTTRLRNALEEIKEKSNAEYLIVAGQMLSEISQVATEALKEGE